MEKLNGQSMNLKENNIENLKQLFPEVFTEGKIDFDKLRLVLGDNIEENDERYEFRWSGKSNAIKIAQTPSMGTLRPDKESSKNWDSTENLYIEGDNLEVLKLLQKSYFGKIKMIYIDPPYNTGKDFVYKDNFRDSIANYKEITNQTTKANAETSGRYHTDWLNMMYPRLKLARNLLREDGIIFISMDENEVFNLKKICDEVFGEENFITNFLWKKKSTSTNTENSKVSPLADYTLTYAKSTKVNLRPRIRLAETRSYPFKDELGSYRTTIIEKKDAGQYKRETMKYEILGQKPREGKRWQIGIEKARELEQKNRFIIDENGVVKLKIYDFEDKNTTSAHPNILENLGSTDTASKCVNKELFNQDELFSNPKPVEFLKFLMNLIYENNDIVLDFFSGSATTAHAVMQLNAEDNGNRKFIMVQLPELTDEKSEAYKAGYKNICEIGKERIRRAGEKIVNESGKTDLDIGFKVFKLDDSNIKEWSPNYDELAVTLEDMTDNLKRGRTKEDLLFEILIKMGIELTAPIEEVNINNKTIYNIGMGSLVICLEDEISEDIIKEIPKYKSEFVDMKVVFKETGFRTDSQKMNAMQNLKQFGITDVRSV